MLSTIVHKHILIIGIIVLRPCGFNFIKKVRQNQVLSRGFYIQNIPSGGALPDLPREPVPVRNTQLFDFISQNSLLYHDIVYSIQIICLYPLLINIFLFYTC